jgi:transposase
MPPTDMYLSDHDLRQLDDAYLDTLAPPQARVLLGKALSDLKAARERLGQNPSNSSRPPSSRAPWESADDRPDAEYAADAHAAPAGTEDAPPSADEPTPAASDAPRRPTGPRPAPGRPGRRRGAPGHSRTQQLPVAAESVHRPACCAACGEALHAAPESRAHTARYEIDLIRPGADGTGLLVQQTKQTDLEVRCACGHWTRAQPGCADSEAEWTVALTEWHLAGPTLVAFICALAQRMRLSRARIRELLHDWLGLDLSVATINQCLHEAGRAVAPVVDGEILATVRNIDLLHADETSWKEHGRLLWRWVFTCATATLFVVGRRTREVVQGVLGATFQQWLMTDGYCAYRDVDQRLRCLAHLIRKAHGLEDSLDRDAQRFGTHILNVLATVIDAVYQARAAPSASGLRQRHAAMLNALFDACIAQADSKHALTRALARELLNDW